MSLDCSSSAKRFTSLAGSGLQLSVGMGERLVRGRGRLSVQAPESFVATCDVDQVMGWTAPSSGNGAKLDGYRARAGTA